MKYRITVTLNEDERYMRVEAKHEYIEEETKDYLEMIFLTLLHSCKKADKKAFYGAMSKFVVDDYDSAKAYVESLEKERRHEN